MARSRKQTPTEPLEIPLEPKPRKSRKRQADSPAGLAPVIQELVDTLPVTVAAELPPPEREVIEPNPNTTRPRDTPSRNGEEHELPTFAEVIEKQRRARPSAPRKRDGEPAASFASQDIRITLQDRVWQVEARRELTGNEKDRLAASGFHAVDDDEKIWNAPQSELVKRQTDINVVAFELSGKAARAR